jgi:hypothetical protein
MTKIKKQNPIPFPQKINMDDLATVDDDVLSNMLRSLNDSIARATGHGLNPMPWEVELCYAQREAQIRTLRKELHAKYLESLPVEVD